MPVVTINGERKKVACGPCIRGHRSSKCQHKDRVLIEVRKPGRPLGTCPHPGGSCGCERIVVNYCLPKSAGNSAATTPINDMPSFSNPAKVQKPSASKGQRQISNLPHATVKDIIQGNAKGLAKLANMPAEFAAAAGVSTSDVDGGISESASSKTDTSSTPSSSSSSTPMVTATNGIAASHGSAQEQSGLFAKWMDYYPSPSATSTSRLTDSPFTNGQTPKSCCAPTPNTPGSESFTSISQAQPNSMPISPQGQIFSAAHPIPPFQLPVSMNYSELDTDFNSYEFSPGCPMPPTQAADGLLVERSCECGDSCSCFACTTHPHNRTTMDYVRYHSNLAIGPQMSNGMQQSPNPQQFFGFSQHQPGQMHMQQMQQIYGANHQQSFMPQPTIQMSSMNWANPQQGHQSLQFPAHQPSLLPSPAIQNHSHINPFSGPGPISHPHTITPLPLLEPSSRTSMAQKQSSISSIPSKVKSEREVDDFTVNGTEMDTMTDEDSTLSPSSFSLQQFTLDCEDTTGTCKCEDGCSCEGCKTHSGHIEA